VAPEMRLTIREMRLSEVSIRIDYFHDATDEYLRVLGVDGAPSTRRTMHDPFATGSITPWYGS